jgi:hypothetical protein
MLHLSRDKVYDLKDKIGGGGLAAGRDFGRLLDRTEGLVGSGRGRSALDHPARHVTQDVEQE